jgi:tetratricopeptide (TPR) repeat protein
MADAAFAQLVSRLTEDFGQQMGSSRQVPEGILLQTTDGFLYAFVADPAALSLAAVQRILRETPGGSRRLVAFCRSRLPLALSEELVHAGATVVEGPRFGELVGSLGLESLLGEEPRPPAPSAARLLPSAWRLDALMGRGRSWLEWGVPALAARFFRQAIELKPGFLPAKIGLANSFLSLGLLPEARQGFAEVRRTDPSHLEARIGEAAVLGAEGHPEAEIAAYRALLTEHPDELSVRAHLVAALVEHHHWTDAKEELASMLDKVPEDARLRFLHAAALEKTGATVEGARERERARRSGLTPEQEAQLSEQLGFPPRAIPEPRLPIPAALATPRPAGSTPPAPPRPPARRAPPPPPPRRARPKARRKASNRAKPRPTRRRPRRPPRKSK